MRVFHASPSIVNKPDAIHSRDNLDFGKGFYVTTLQDQAINYATRFQRRGRTAYLNEYEFYAEGLNRFKTLSFAKYDEAWLDFVMQCRNGEDDTDWDVVRGGVANDRVFTTVDLYFAGEITKAEALGRLAYERPND